MLLRLLKTSYNAGYLIFPVILAGTWLNHLIHPYFFSFSQNIDSYILFGIINGLLPKDLLLRTSLSLLLLITNGYLLQRIYREYLLPGQGSLLPAVLFILICGGYPGFQTLHPVWFAIVFLLLGLYKLFAAFDIRKPFSDIFDAGILLSIGSLFYFNLLFCLPAFMVGAFSLPRDARWREIVILFIGALVPWIITLSVYFILDQTAELFLEIRNSVVALKTGFEGNIPLMIFTGYLVLLTLTGSNLILRQYEVKKVSFRKYFTFFLLLFVSSIFIYFLIPAASTEIFIIASVPVTFLLSNFFISSKRSFISEVLFIVILGLVVYFQLK
jgi:hypothetical protein